MRLGAAVERLHHGARQDLDLLRDGVVRLHLALERLDRGLGLALARHDRQHVGDRLAGIRRAARGRPTKRRWIASTLLSRNRLLTSRAITAPAPATPAVTAVAASAPKRRAALERSRDPIDGVDRQPAGDEYGQPGDAEADDAIAARAPARPYRAARSPARSA